MKTRLFYDSGYFYEDIIFIVSIRFDAEYINTYVCMYAKKSLYFNNMSIIFRIPNFILSNAEISRFTSSVCCVFAKELVNLHRNSISIIFGIPELLFSYIEISGFMNSIYVCMQTTLFTSQQNFHYFRNPEIIIFWSRNSGYTNWNYTLKIYIQVPA